MKPKQITHDGLIIAGISITTTNEDELKGTGMIPTLWNRFYTEQISKKMPEKLSSHVYSVYSNYVDGIFGEYQVTIGHPVSEGQRVSESLTVKHLPPSKYLVFTSQKGPISEIVFSTWKRIWNWFEENKVARAYTGDFELYDERSLNPEEAVMDIYISIK